MYQDYDLFQIVVSLKEENMFNLKGVVFLHLSYSPLKNIIIQENKFETSFSVNFNKFTNSISS